MKTYTYLLLHLVIVIFPLLNSFDGKINYYRNWKYLFPGMIFAAVLFIAWDVWFTSMNVWHFNPEYVLGIFIWGLPIEEWMFFLTVPFSCIFIYEALNYYIKKDYFKKFSNSITLFLIAFFLLLAIFNYSKLYTVLSMSTASFALLLHKFYFSNQSIGRFYLAYLVHLIPFFVINGILTSLPVVIYNNYENLGLRIGTIPLEDMTYSMTLLLVNISSYEYFKDRELKKKTYGI